MTANVPTAPLRPRAPRRQAPRRSLARFIRALQAQLPELSARYHVKSLGVFGSYVRREEKRSSDFDLLVEFAPAEQLPRKLALAAELSKALGVKVDVVQREGLPYYIGKRVLREVIWLQKEGVVLPVQLPRRKVARPNRKPNGANMEPKREYLDYLQDMLDNMARVQRFVAGMTMAQMIEDMKTDFAVRYALQIIGEAANRIPPEIRKLYPHIPWRQIIDFRNAMAHGYDRLVYSEVWDVITKFIPRDQPLVAQMLQTEKQRRGLAESESEKEES